MTRSGFIFVITSSIVLASSALPASGATIDWSIIHPFRFYKKLDDFDRHRQAFDRILKANGDRRPADVIRQMERDLNAPECTDPSTPATCGTTDEQRRLGWAARSYTESDVCYGRRDDQGHLRYEIDCERRYPWGPVVEDYVKPRSHAVRVGLIKADRERLNNQRCSWRWSGLGEQADVHGEQLNINCADEITVRSVPWPEGVHLTLEAPDGVVQQDILVKDILVVGLGDSFASGEGNPDKPIQPHSSQAIIYGDNSAYASAPLPFRNTGLGERPNSGTADGRRSFFGASAHWISPDCHRSQYSYQFRVALQLAVEDPKRAVTFIHLACTGAEITEGLFGPKDAREQLSEAKQVLSQFDTLLDMLCEERKGRTYEYPLPLVRRYGQRNIKTEPFFVKGCKAGKTKREIDLMMLSFGGNDIGFSALVGYVIMKQSGALAPIIDIFEFVTGKRVTFDTGPAAVYLEFLDRRFSQTKKAFQQLLNLAPDRVVQTAYEPIMNSADGSLCRGNAFMNVHRGFQVIDKRMQEVNRFTTRFFNRLECVADRRSRPDCPTNLTTGNGTGFRFVTTHQKEFARRGLCAGTPAELNFAKIATIPIGDTEFTWTPSWYQPYGPRSRLFVAPNDAFLTANTHMDGATAPFYDDPLQVGIAALYSGAFHRSAEAHAIVADHVFPQAKEILSSQK